MTFSTSGWNSLRSLRPPRCSVIFSLFLRLDWCHCHPTTPPQIFPLFVMHCSRQEIQLSKMFPSLLALSHSPTCTVHSSLTLSHYIIWYCEESTVQHTVVTSLTKFSLLLISSYRLVKSNVSQRERKRCIHKLLCKGLW